MLEFRPTVILAADLAYLEPVFPLLLRTLDDLLSLSGGKKKEGKEEGEAREGEATVYFCLQKRRRADARFLRRARKAFEIVDAVDEERSRFERDRLFLFEFRRRRPGC